MGKKLMAAAGILSFAVLPLFAGIASAQTPAEDLAAAIRSNVDNTLDRVAPTASSDLLFGDGWLGGCGGCGNNWFGGCGGGCGWDTCGWGGGCGGCGNNWFGGCGGGCGNWGGCGGCGGCGGWF